VAGEVIAPDEGTVPSIEEYLQALAAAGEIELVDETEIIWCERCGAGTDRGACGCVRMLRQVR
jgi:hypothetical protein